MKSINRRQFSVTFGCVVGGCSLGLLPGLAKIVRSRKTNTKGHQQVGLQPIEGFAYTDSLLTFMRNARFDSADQALHAIANPTVPFRLVLVPV